MADIREQELDVLNTVDGRGNPTGGYVRATGLSIDWQDGPLGRPPAEPNGCFTETVIRAALQRLQFYNDSQYSCRENSLAITKLEEALHWLRARREEREARGVQGLHAP